METSGKAAQTNSKISNRFREVECPEPVEGFSYVYILQSADGTYYAGQTRDLRERLRKHRLGLGANHTGDHPGPRLVFWEVPLPPKDAVARESQFKRWSRAKKEALIKNDVLQLKLLARSRN